MQRLHIFALILLLNACNNKGDNSAPGVLNESIVSATRSIETWNWEIYTLFNAQMEDPKTRYKTGIWKPHADRIQNLSNHLVEYIQSAKKQIKPGMPSFQLRSFYDSLVYYQSAMLNINERLTREFKHAVLISNFNDDTLQCSYNDFEHIFLSAESPEMYNALFNVLENKIRRTENNMIRFCQSNTISYSCGYEKLEPLVAMDKSVVGPNETIEILAGLGQISTTTKTTVSISGKHIPNDWNGVAKYKFNVGNTKGKHNVLIAIDYIDPSTGETRAISKTISYTVR